MPQPAIQQIRQPGISLAEYGLVGGLLVTIAIAGFTLLGNDLQGVLSSLLSDMQNQPIAVANAKQSALDRQAGQGTSSGTTLSAKNDPASGSGPSTSNNTIDSSLRTVCFYNRCLDVPEIAPGPVANTNGALGGELVSSLADVIRQIAADLQKDPDADPSLVSLITTLANQGHSIADAQRDLYAHCPTQECTGTTKTSFDIMADSSLNVDKLVSNVAQSGSTFKSTLATLQDYLSKNPHSLPSHYSSLILQEAQLITTIADSVQIKQENVPNGIFTNKQTTGWQVSDTAVLTEQSANSICDSGGDTTQCIVKS